MFRHRVHPPTPSIDDATAERLLAGGPLDDLPDAHRRLGQLLAAASGPGTPAELEGSATAAAAFVAIHEANRPVKRKRVLVGALTVVGLLVVSTGTAFAAAQGSLPGPIQQAAHDTLGVVGISVPSTTSDRGSVDSGSDPTPSATTGGGDAPTSRPRPTARARRAGAATRRPTVATTTAGGGTSTPTPTTAPAAADTEAPANPGSGGSGSSGGSAGDDSAGGGASADHPAQGGGGATSPADPGTNLPPQSQGKGNGPPQVPPGQAKKGA